MSAYRGKADFARTFGASACCAAGLATLDVHRDEWLFERAGSLEGKWADAAMSLKGTPGVLDIRTHGLVAAIDLASKPDAFGKRACDSMERPSTSTA